MYMTLDESWELFLVIYEICQWYNIRENLKQIFVKYLKQT
jgi:hypothetical protein